MSVGKRYLSRHGQDATLQRFDPDTSESGLNEYRQPTDPGAQDPVSTTAAVELQSRRNPEVVKAGGEEIVADATIWVPDSVTVDPEATEAKPQITIGSNTWKIWAVDPGGSLPGLQRLLATKVR